MYIYILYLLIYLLGIHFIPLPWGHGITMPKKNLGIGNHAKLSTPTLTNDMLIRKEQQIKKQKDKIRNRSPNQGKKPKRSYVFRNRMEKGRQITRNKHSGPQPSYPRPFDRLLQPAWIIW